MGGQVSIHGDIYSYGILLLEMFTGKRPTDSEFKDDLNIYNFVLMALPDHVMDIIDPSMFFGEEVNDRDISSDHIEERAVITYNDPNVSIQSLEIEEYLVSVMRIGLACTTTFPRERMAMKDVLKNLQFISFAQWERDKCNASNREEQKINQIPEFLTKLVSLRHPNLSFNELDGEVSKEGIFANATAISLIGNDKLCGGVSELLLPVCSGKKPGKLLTPNGSIGYIPPEYMGGQVSILGDIYSYDSDPQAGIQRRRRRRRKWITGRKKPKSKYDGSWLTTIVARGFDIVFKSLLVSKYTKDQPDSFPDRGAPIEYCRTDNSVPEHH
ncbi:hypothetical protein Q3G72_010328 [Acer saccharum]|nr:hypothetical protein Q3G72_010328 [Acer saccharum]